MNRMFFIPRIAMPHIIAALRAEIDEELDVAAWIESGDEDDWPEGYDPNDLPLFESVVEGLAEADREKVEAIKIWGKPLAFMAFPLTEYLQRRGSTLTVEERLALEDVQSRARE
jgi:hypothetical protein